MICGHCCLTGCSLVMVTWLLWQAAAPMAPDAPVEGAAVVQRFKTRDECLKAATIKRGTRNMVILRGATAYEVFTCAPEGTERAQGRRFGVSEVRTSRKVTAVPKDRGGRRASTQ